MLKPEVVVLDFEGFRHKKSGFIIEEISICSNNYTDTILFIPPVSYNSLSASERKSHQWVSRFYTVCRGIVVIILTVLYLKFLLQLNFDFFQESFMLKGKRKLNHCQHFYRKK